MAGKLPMGQKELLRGKVLEQVKTGPLTLKEAALRLKNNQPRRRADGVGCFGKV
jgi:hypothetical protein